MALFLAPRPQPPMWNWHPGLLEPKWSHFMRGANLAWWGAGGGGDTQNHMTGESATLIGAGIASDFNVSFSITPEAANTIYVGHTIAEGISIQNMTVGDTISLGLTRLDATNSLYPFTITINYVIFSTGEHV